MHNKYLLNELTVFFLCGGNHKAFHSLGDIEEWAIEIRYEIIEERM